MSKNITKNETTTSARRRRLGDFLGRWGFWSAAEVEQVDNFILHEAKLIAVREVERMRSESLATRQRLPEKYRAHLKTVLGEESRTGRQGASSPLPLEIMRGLQKRGLVTDLNTRHDIMRGNRLVSRRHLVRLTSEGRRLAEELL